MQKPASVPETTPDEKIPPAEKPKTKKGKPQTQKERCVTVAEVDADAFEIPANAAHPAAVSQETGTPLYDMQLKEYVT